MQFVPKHFIIMLFSLKPSLIKVIHGAMNQDCALRWFGSSVMENNKAVIKFNLRVDEALLSDGGADKDHWDIVHNNSI